MNDSRNLATAFSVAEEFANVETFATNSKEVNRGLHRLEGAFYGSNGYRAVLQMKRSRFKIESVGDHSEVTWHGPFARTFVDDTDAGVPFLSSSDIMLSKIEPTSFLSRQLTSRLERLLVSSGTIMVSCSGTIGNVALCTPDIDGMAVSQHAIRVVTDKQWSGVIYCFLESDLGQFLVTRNKSGSVIESIYEGDVANLPLPLLPAALRTELTRLLDESCQLRATANRLLDEAIADVQHQCYLPDIGDFHESHVNGDQPLTFVHSAAKRLFDESLGFGERRLDATYHEPAAVAVARYILSHGRGHRLGDLLVAVRNSTLRKRNYVDDSELGVALIGGKQLMQWRPHGLKYLSKALTRNLSNETAERGWTIVSCGGTLGRCQYIHRNFEGWAMSQDVMRIIPDESNVASGFIYAFLASEYGQIQIQSRGYGSVIPRLRDFQFNSIAIPLPDDKGEAIHEKVVSAYDARGDAHDLEDEAFRLFETAIERGRAYTEAEWGSEY